MKCKKRNVNIGKIKIPEGFKHANPNPLKVIDKVVDYLRYGRIDNIYVDENYNLIDGYISFLIRYQLSENRIKVVMVKGDQND